MRAVEYLKWRGWVWCGVFALVAPTQAVARAPDDNSSPPSVEAGPTEFPPVEGEPVENASVENVSVENGPAEIVSIEAGPTEFPSVEGDSVENGPTEIEFIESGSAEIESAEIGSAEMEGGFEPSAPKESPLRISAAYEFGYKVQNPTRTTKNRASLRLEYARTFNGRFSVQFDGKANAFLGHDHRRAIKDNDVMVTQAYLQTSIGETSVRAGVQTLAWGESILAPITDEISPRDNRELFNFNLEELRIGQPMLVVDRYSQNRRWGVFWIPAPSFNKSPAEQSIYNFDPFAYRHGIEGDGGAEYGLSWKRSYNNADFTLMAASLVDNDYARRVNGDGSVSRVRERFTLTGLSFTRAMGNFVLRGEAAVKFGKPFNNAAVQIVEKRTIETYVSLDYQVSPTLSFTAELLNQHVSDWETDTLGVARNRQTLMLSAQKNFMNDDLSITLRNFSFWPHASNLPMLLASWKASDNLTMSLNLTAPMTSQRNGSLWAVRDQKQTLFKIQWQF